jgi:hypothetical protein
MPFNDDDSQQLSKVREQAGSKHFGRQIACAGNKVRLLLKEADMDWLGKLAAFKRERFVFTPE